MEGKLNQLETEQVNSSTQNIDEATTKEMLTLINQEDAYTCVAVKACIEDISLAVDCIHDKLRQGGRLFYIGAGTSGRLGVLDASECPPTFGVDPSLVQGIIAGGSNALTNAMENVEDSCDEAKLSLINRQLTNKDVVCGIASSGKTPYVKYGLEYARSIGCKTISISCVTSAEISNYADIPIECITGPEAVTGSTRMKAGTAQKMILNMLSTGTMIKLGKVYKNLMVDVQPTNDKLRSRAVNIVVEATGCDIEVARKVLLETEYSVKETILMILTSKNQQECSQLLVKYDQHISKAIHASKDTKK